MHVHVVRYITSIYGGTLPWKAAQRTVFYRQLEFQLRRLRVDLDPVLDVTNAAGCAAAELVADLIRYDALIVALHVPLRPGPAHIAMCLVEAGVLAALSAGDTALADVLAVPTLECEESHKRKEELPKLHCLVMAS